MSQVPDTTAWHFELSTSKGSDVLAARVMLSGVLTPISFAFCHLHPTFPSCHLSDFSAIFVFRVIPKEHNFARCFRLEYFRFFVTHVSSLF